MTTPPFLAHFDAALDAIDAAGRAKLRTASGEPADSELAQLRAALVEEREASLARGAVNRERVGALVRDLVRWYPEGRVKLIAALGAIARG